MFFIGNNQKFIMKDFRAISRTIYGKVKSSIGVKTEFGKTFKEKDPEYFSKIFDTIPKIHSDLINFINSNDDIKTILEIGCGTANFSAKFPKILEDKDYTGLDISENNIKFCKETYKHNFICADFLKIELEKNFDLIFTEAVVDHVYDIDLFIEKVVKTTKKYAYIHSYRGFFPELEKHEMDWRDDDGIYYNKLSVKQIKNTLIKCGLDESEFKIRPQQASNKKEIMHTIIEINKKTKG